MKKYSQKNYKINIFLETKLSNLTTFNIGGHAKYFCLPKNEEEIKDSLKFAKDFNLKTFVIGGGSNLLISDNGFNGLIISCNKLNKISINGTSAEAECGVSIDELNKKLLINSLTGLEFSGGLPGSIGGAVFMNARAYGGQFSDVVKSVHVITQDNKEMILSKNELNFSYKKSIFMDKPEYFIYKIILNLNKGKKGIIGNTYNKNIMDRIKKEQLKYPSAGCIFKNNYNSNLIAGKLIEDMGLKGFKIGEAEIFENHANFIINKGNAEAKDVLKLIEYIEEKAIKEKGIKLEREVILVGFDSR